MAYSAEQKRRLLARTLPEREALIARVHEYKARTGLSNPQLAQRIGRSPVSVTMFLAGRYCKIAGDDAQIRADFADYMDSHPVGSEDDLLGGRVYEFQNAQLLRQDFFDALDRARIIVRHGNPGTQKTFISRALIAELNRLDQAKNGVGRRAYRVYCSQGITPLQLLRKIARVCGVPGGCTCDAIVINLQHEFRRRRVLLVLDEAQHLSEASIEVLRELNDEPPRFGLMFLGSHDLKERFNGFHMEQYRSRIHVLDSLPGMDKPEARQAIAGELGELPEKKILAIIEKATVRDERQRGVTYISAREVFRAIDAIQEARSQKGGAQ